MNNTKSLPLGMDLQTRKLNIIEYLIGLQDEKLFKHIEETIMGSTTVEPVKLTKEELIDRAQKSNKDYESGNYTSQDELNKESESW